MLHIKKFAENELIQINIIQDIVLSFSVSFTDLECISFSMFNLLFAKITILKPKPNI